MIKKTLCFSNPAFLSLKNKQMEIRLPESQLPKTKYKIFDDNYHSIPIEDIGVVVLENNQITITSALLEALLANNSAVITCDSSRMPSGLLLPLSGNSVQSERFRDQINSSLPLRKQLWQQTIQSKIYNQAVVLSKHTKCETGNMFAWINKVKSGDTENLEARAAVYYWRNVFPSIPLFIKNLQTIY